MPYYLNLKDILSNPLVGTTVVLRPRIWPLSDGTRTVVNLPISSKTDSTGSIYYNNLVTPCLLELTIQGDKLKYNQFALIPSGSNNGFPVNLSTYIVSASIDNGNPTDIYFALEDVTTVQLAGSKVRLKPANPYIPNVNSGSLVVGDYEQFIPDANATFTASQVVPGGYTVEYLDTVTNKAIGLFSILVPANSGSLTLNQVIVPSTTNQSNVSFPFSNGPGQAFTIQEAINTFQKIIQTGSFFDISVTNAVTSSLAQTGLFAYVAETADFAVLATEAIHCNSSSFSSQAISASYAVTASWALLVSASAVSGSVANAVSASFAVSASWAPVQVNVNSASLSQNAISASYALSASFATNSSTSNSASMAVLSNSASAAISSSYAQNSSTSNTASYALTASFVQTASLALLAQTASFALNASVIVTSASYAINAVTASFVPQAVFATSSLSASYALSASFSNSSSFTLSSSNAVSASYTVTASYSQQATTSSYVKSSSYALSASEATLANSLPSGININEPALFWHNDAHSSYQIGEGFGNPWELLYTWNDGGNGEVLIGASTSSIFFVPPVVLNGLSQTVLYADVNGQITTVPSGSSSPMTSSWALNAVTSSFALTASQLVGRATIYTASLVWDDGSGNYIILGRYPSGGAVLEWQSSSLDTPVPLMRTIGSSLFFFQTASFNTLTGFHYGTASWSNNAQSASCLSGISSSLIYWDHTHNGDLHFYDNRPGIAQDLFKFVADNGGQVNYYQLKGVNNAGGLILVSSNDGRIVEGTATTLETSYLSGVTGSIQTQLNGKQNSSPTSSYLNGNAKLPLVVSDGFSSHSFSAGEQDIYGTGISSLLTITNGFANTTTLESFTTTFGLLKTSTDTLRLVNNTGTLYFTGSKLGVGVITPVNSLDVLGNISCSVVSASTFTGKANTAISASFATLALTASYSLNANLTSSYAVTASHLIGNADLPFVVSDGNSSHSFSAGELDIYGTGILSQLTVTNGFANTTTIGSFTYGYVKSSTDTLRLFNSGPNMIMYLTGSKVGLNIASPVNTLDVLGNISASVFSGSIFTGRANTAISASFATSASYARNSTSASFAISSSYASSGILLGPSASVTIDNNGIKLNDLKNGVPFLSTAVPGDVTEKVSVKNLAITALTAPTANTILVGDQSGNVTDGPITTDQLPTPTSTFTLGSSTVIVSKNTGSYNAMFNDWVAISGSNQVSGGASSAGGSIFGIFDSGSISYTQYVTNNIGPAPLNDITMSMILNGSNVQVVASTPNSSVYLVKVVSRFV